MWKGGETTSSKGGYRGKTKGGVVHGIDGDMVEGHGGLMSMDMHIHAHGGYIQTWETPRHNPWHMGLGWTRIIIQMHNTHGSKLH